MLGPGKDLDLDQELDNKMEIYVVIKLNVSKHSIRINISVLVIKSGIKISMKLSIMINKYIIIDPRTRKLFFMFNQETLE